MFGGEEGTEGGFVGFESFLASVGDAADGVGEAAESRLGHFQIACLLEGLDLDAEVASGGFRNLTEIHEVGTLEAVEGHHDLQAQLVVEQGIDDGKLKCTHSA